MRAALVAVAWCLAGCGLGSGSSVGEPRPELGIGVFLDGAEVARYAGPESVELRTLLPESGANPASWTHVGAMGDGGRAFAVKNPSIRYPAGLIELYVDAQGAAGLRIVTGPRQPTRGLAKADSVQVATRPMPAGKARPEPRGISVQILEEGRTVISGSALASLPQTEDPKGKPSWALIDVVKLRVGDRPIDAVELLANDEVLARVGIDQLKAAGSPWRVKHNKNGQLRVQDWGTEPEAHPAQVFKDVLALRVVPSL